MLNRLSITQAPVFVLLIIMQNVTSAHIVRDSFYNLHVALKSSVFVAGAYVFLTHSSKEKNKFLYPGSPTVIPFLVECPHDALHLWPGTQAPPLQAGRPQNCRHLAGGRRDPLARNFPKELIPRYFPKTPRSIIRTEGLCTDIAGGPDGCDGAFKQDPWLWGPSGWFPLYIHACTHTHARTRTYTHAHTGTHIYTCTYTCTHTYTHTHMHTQIHTYIHAHIHAHTCAHTRTHIHMHTQVHTYTCTYTHTCTHTCTHTHTHTRTYICTHRYIYTCTHTRTHVHTHARVHTHAHTSMRIHMHTHMHTHTCAHTCPG